MNTQIKQEQVTLRRRNGYVYPDGVLTYSKKSSSLPRLKRKNYAFSVNPLTPVYILEAKWNKWGEPDEIIYKSVSGTKYLINHENLLADITEFMKQNRLKGSLPYLHIEGRDGWECYRKPAKNHILEFLRAYLCNYGIYSINGDLVQEANNERRRFTLCVNLD